GRESLADRDNPHCVRRPPGGPGGLGHAFAHGLQAGNDCCHIGRTLRQLPSIASGHPAPPRPAPEPRMDISELLAFSVKNKASDLHLSSGLPPMIRVNGDVRRINLPPMEHKDVHGMIYDIMNDGQRKAYEERLEVDFSFAIPGLARFRVNAFNQDRGAAAVLRTIPSRILSLEELNAPKIFAELALK